MTPAKDVDAYIDGALAAARPMLREVRRIILDAVPSVTEKISYGMPSYEHRGQRLVNFSAAKAHVGVYGLVHVNAAVPDELAPYLVHQSTLRFRFDQALPAAALSAAIRQKAGTP